MGSDETTDEWPVVGEDGSSPDLSRKEAAFERERARLVRDHLGKFAVVRFDEVVGVYDTFEEATEDAHRRFGWGRMIICLIEPDNGPEWISNVDTNHPSFKPLD